MEEDNVREGRATPSFEGTAPKSHESGAVRPSAPRTESKRLRPYLSAGWQLIPLHRWDDRDQDGRARGKSPLHCGWTDRRYSSDDQVAHMDAGGNVDVRLSERQLVIDVDPRNFGAATPGVDPFDELVLELGLDPTDWPCVQTGSGGWHYYLTKPADSSVVNSVNPGARRGHAPAE